MAEKPLQSLTIQGLSGTYVNTPLSTAPVFDNTTTYVIGDYVFYNRKLYKFILAHSAGNWDPTQVSEITIGSELKNLKDESVTDVQVDGTSVVTDGVAEIPIGSSTDFGVLKSNSAGGVTAINGVLEIVKATNSDMKGGSNNYRPIVSNNQHISTFYGLAKVAGDTSQASSDNTIGNYTDNAKAAIKSMLGVQDSTQTVVVSGTTPTITALTNTRYICGEVATLTITPPGAGICEVVFTSGSTPTVLTAIGVTFPSWFDSSALEANTTYEISIADGKGVVCTWAS